jgi:PIN domain nuclease of toxin-antitoxin system
LVEGAARKPRRRARHTLGLTALPPLHRDPFDRLLIAQARATGLTLLTCDTMVGEYEYGIVYQPAARLSS